MTSSIVVTPKRHFLAQKHVAWAIKRENRSTRSTWAQDREKKGQDRTVKKVTKALYFTYLGRSPHWTDFHKNLHSSCHPRRNHVCKILSWNFQGLRFYRGSNFPFSYWFFHGPYNSAALLRCLWSVLKQWLLANADSKRQFWLGLCRCFNISLLISSLSNKSRFVSLPKPKFFNELLGTFEHKPRCSMVSLHKDIMHHSEHNIVYSDRNKISSACYSHQHMSYWAFKKLSLTLTSQLISPTQSHGQKQNLQLSYRTYALDYLLYALQFYVSSHIYTNRVWHPIIWAYFTHFNNIVIC